ncbi:MAG: oligosaccharide flippase family protein [Gammaproteobacteria bacterium]
MSPDPGQPVSTGAANPAGKGAAVRAASRAGLYGLGAALQSLVGFLMLPIYTRYLSPADYGVVSLLAVLNGFVGLFFGMQVVTGLFRHYFAEKDEAGRKAVISTAIGLAVVGKLLGLLTLWAFAGPAASFMFGEPGYTQYVMLFGITLVTDALVFIPMQYLRALDRPVVFVLVSAAKLLLQLVLNIWLVVFLGMGVMGVIISGVVGGSAIGLLMSGWALSRTGLRFDRATAGKLFNYSWPLVVASFISLYVTMGDRYFVRRFIGLDAVGLYALAYRLAMVLQVLIAKPFNQYWGAERFRVFQEGADLGIYRINFRFLSALLIAVGCGLALFAPEFLKVMSDKAFWPAAALVPVLVLAKIVDQVGRFNALGLFVADKTPEQIRVSILEALAASGFFVGLIPLIGAQGAALGLLAAALARLWWSGRKASEHLNLGLPWRDFWLAVGIAGLAVGAGMLGPSDFWESLALKSGIYVAFTVLLFASPLVGREGRSGLVGLLREARARFGSRPGVGAG